VWLDDDSQIIDRDDWFQVSTPSTSVPNKNLIYRAVMDERDADARIVETLAPYRARASSVRWVTGPASRPADLGARLLAHGLIRDADSVAMFADVHTLELAPSPGVTVERLGHRNLDHFCETWARGWEQPSSAADGIRREMIRVLSGVAGGVSAYLARIDGAPAGTAILKTVPGSGLLQGASVDPEYRSCGVFRSLIQQRMADARAAGMDFVTILADADTSAPICEALGFVAACRFEYYGLKP